MASKKVVIDIGHYESDSGAVGNGWREVDLNYSIAKYLADRLTQLGFNVLITKGTLAQRCAAERAFNADCVVSIHNNAGGGDGVEVLYLSDNGKKLAGCILNKIVSANLNNSRGLKYRPDLYMLKNTASTAALVECAFVDNKADITAVDEEHERKAFGYEIANGICEYLGVTPQVTPPPTPPTPPSYNANLVEITVDVLNVRSGPSDSYGVNRQVYRGDVYTIVELNNGWGKLKSGAGWIYMAYTKNVESTQSFKPYTVKITTSALNVRKGPGVQHATVTTVKLNEVYTIVDVKDGWGKLKSGAGWISLSYTKPV